MRKLIALLTFFFRIKNDVIHIQEIVNLLHKSNVKVSDDNHEIIELWKLVNLYLTNKK